MWDKIKISQLPEEFTISRADYLVTNVDDKVSSKISYQNFLDTLTSENLVWTGNLNFQGNVVLPPGTETDPIFIGSPAFTITQDDIDRWNEAYSWGDHSLEGYIKAGDVPTGFLMPGDNVSLLFNDPPYVTESELNTIIDGLDFITVGDLDLILGGHGYLKPGDPVSLLLNDVPYMTEIAVRCILDGNSAQCTPDYNSRGYLKRAVNGIPIDKVSELENDVPYVTEASLDNVSTQWLRRRDESGNFRDDNVELANGMGYLEHTWDGDPLVDYDLEILSNVNADAASDGDTIVKQGDYWVAGDGKQSLGSLHFEGAVDVGVPYSFTLTEGSVVVQYHYSEGPRYIQAGWDFINPPADGQVQHQQYMILLSTGQWVLCGQWNDQLQSDWQEANEWHPAYIRNKPQKLSDIIPNSPDYIGEGDIELEDGFGTIAKGPVANANQLQDTKHSVDLNVKLDGGIIIDGNNQIEIDWNTFVGDGDIIIEGTENEIVVSGTPEQPHANQDCETTTKIGLSAVFLQRIADLESRIAALEANP